MSNSFTYTEEMMELCLKANGYGQSWKQGDWTPPNCTNPDHVSLSTSEAFFHLLYSKNLFNKEWVNKEQQ